MSFQNPVKLNLVKFKTIFKITIIAFEIFLPFILSYLCQRLSIGRGYELTSINPYILVINYILWGSSLLFFTSLFKKNYRSIFVYLIVFVLFSLINRYKIKLINQPFQIGDLNLAKNASGIIPFVKDNHQIKKELAIIFIGLISSFFVIKKIINLKTKNIFLRLLFFIISIFIISFSYFLPQCFNQILNQSNVKFNQWDNRENCQKNGMFLCFIYNFQFLHHTSPTNYNQETINNIYQSISSTYQNNSDIKPNIILILSESLWDATKLSNTTLSKDPISSIRSDIKGNFISPAFGGETANVEFEILTGLNNYFFEKNSYPYSEFIKKPTPSLFTLFKNNGYATTAIHPYSSWFYNRQNVYQYFGLDKFTNLDNMSGYENAGPFVSSKSFTQEIIKQFNSTDQSQFIFALSIQNHAPYEINRFENKQIDIKTSLNENDKGVFQSYIEGINLSDQYYQVLKEEIKKSSKPTIIILFGDHLPSLGSNFDIYKKTNFVPLDETQWTIEDKFKMQSTPISIWTNFSKNIPSIGNISPAFLSNTILDLANINPEYQFKFTQQIHSIIPYLTKKINSDISTQSANLEKYNLIQYDLLFGKQYTWQNR